jgi:hypothetical protein
MGERGTFMLFLGVLFVMGVEVVMEGVRLL